MADLSDIENALAGMIAGALYPNGTGQPSAIAAPVRIYPGWPAANKLDTDLRAGTVNVSVFPMPGERNTTRYARELKELSRTPKTLTATIAAHVVTLGGTITTPQHVAVIVNGKSYAYALQPTDTLTTVATALATLVSVDTPASSVGPAITIPGSYGLKVNIGTNGTLARELKRQEKRFQISVWAPTPALRAAAGPIVDGVLAVPAFIALADGTNGRLIYVSTNDTDEGQTELVYRRDITYSVEWPTIDTIQATEITVITEAVEVTNANVGDIALEITYGGEP